MPAKKRISTEEPPLTKREAQIMDVAYRLREATAREIMDNLPDAPGYSSVRTLLGLLVKKGLLVCMDHERTHLYLPAQPRQAAAESSLRRLLRTFFDGSVAGAVSGLLSLKDQRLTAEEIARLEDLIAKTKREASHD